MRNVFIAVLAAVVFVGCATHRNAFKVKMWPPSNTVSDEITVIVQSDGSFQKEIRKGDSTVKLSGRVTPVENGRHEIAFDYLYTIGDGSGEVITWSIQSAISLYAGSDCLVDPVIMKDKDGKTHPMGPGDGVSLELISPE